MDHIYEDDLEQGPLDKPWMSLMSPERRKRGEFYAQEYLTRKAELSEYAAEWTEIQKLYECNRDKDPNDPKKPCNFLPLLTPNVEGQTAAMVETDVEFNYVTNNPAHEDQVKKLNPASKYNRRKAQFMRQVKDHVRQYLLLGNGWLTTAWEKNFGAGPGQPSGYAKTSNPSLYSVFVDGKIKDYKDLQYAEYIIHEIGFQSIGWARKEYGDAYADAVAAGLNEYQGDEAETSIDDFDSFTLLHVWTRNNDQGNLQLIEMDVNGLILRESPADEPYYKYVDNEYPFYFTRGMPKEGCFYGFGDGKILQRFQESINCMADELELGVRFSSQSKTFVDPAGEMDDGQLNSDPTKAVVCKNPRQNILQTVGVGVNPVVNNTLLLYLDQSQKATRFSDLMNGIAQGSSATATQINGQLSQGAVGVRDKKSDISAAMAWADRYGLKLCLEYWDKPFWTSFGSDKERAFIDVADIALAPASVPRTTAHTKELLDPLLAENKPIDPDTLPDWDPVYGEDGEPLLIALDFDVDVVIGSAVPRGKNDMYNIILGLMQIQAIDEKTGQPVPFLKLKKAQELIEEFLGIKIADDEDKERLNSAVPAPINNGGINPIGANDNIQVPQGGGMAAGQMANVPGIPGMDLRGLSL